MAYVSEQRHKRTNDSEKLADALIAAGIGDVKEDEDETRKRER